MLNYMRVSAAVPTVTVADTDANISDIISIIKKAYENGTHLIVFPELSITGYTCGDLFFQSHLLESAKNALKFLLNATKEMDIVITVGLPVEIENKLYNCACVTHKGNIMGIVPKSNLANIEDFFEKRWFSSPSELNLKSIDLFDCEVPVGTDLIFNIKEKKIKIGVEIGEDLHGPVAKSSLLALKGADIILNLSAKAFPSERRLTSLVKTQSERINCGYVLASSGIFESTTDAVFTGKSLIAENGSILKEGSPFSKNSYFISSDLDLDCIRKERLRNKDFFANTSESSNIINLSLSLKENNEIIRKIAKNPYLPSEEVEKKQALEEIFKVQYTSVSKRFLHTGIKKAIIAVSGGLDSTQALLVTVKAFDFMGISRKNIIGITMPGFGTTGRTYDNAKKLMEYLEISTKEISIKEACLLHFKDIGHDAGVHSVAYENAQARERTQIAMDIANMENALVVGTGDLSELALGFATYNGDHMSMYNVNGGVPKTVLKDLVKWAADSNILGQAVSPVLLDIADTPISPELLPPADTGETKQVTEDILGPYEINDFFLYYVMKYGFSPAKIAALAENAFGKQHSKKEYLEMLKNFYRRFFTQQYKRSCMPDGPKAVEISLSPRAGFKMPSDASYQIWTKEIDALLK